MDKSLQTIQKLSAIIYGIDFSLKPQMDFIKLAVNGVIYVFFILTMVFTLTFHSSNILLDKLFLICGLWGTSNGLLLFMDFYLKREKYQEFVKWINDRVLIHLSMSNSEEVSSFKEFSRKISMIIL